MDHKIENATHLFSNLFTAISRAVTAGMAISECNKTLVALMPEDPDQAISHIFTGLYLYTPHYAEVKTKWYV